METPSITINVTGDLIVAEPALRDLAAVEGEALAAEVDQIRPVGPPATWVPNPSTLDVSDDDWDEFTADACETVYRDTTTGEDATAGPHGSRAYLQAEVVDGLVDLGVYGGPGGSMRLTPQIAQDLGFWLLHSSAALTGPPTPNKEDTSA